MAVLSIETLLVKFGSGKSPRSQDYLDLIDTLADDRNAVYFSATAPADTAANPLWFNTNTNVLSAYSAGSWRSGEGPQGPAGATGATGATGAAGAAGATGSQGPQGEVGPAGATGPKGDKGDTGDAGASGSNGVDGKTILSGSGTPSSGTGVNGDFYIDTANNLIFGPKSAGAWGSGTSIVGPTGATGATGATGPQGATGATGATGAAGATGATGTILADDDQSILAHQVFG
jgi:hypothetical protein